MEKLTKKDLARLVKEKVGGTFSEAEKIVGEIFNTISEEIAKGNEVAISKFGKFSQKVISAGERHIPGQPDKKVMVKEYKTIKFKPSRTQRHS